jgi:hypothetical protein
VSLDGKKTEVTGIPKALVGGQGGWVMLLFIRILQTTTLFNVDSG